jgi:hypothetical protein
MAWQQQLPAPPRAAQGGLQQQPCLGLLLGLEPLMLLGLEPLMLLGLEPLMLLGLEPLMLLGLEPLMLLGLAGRARQRHLLQRNLSRHHCWPPPLKQAWWQRHHPQQPHHLLQRPCCQSAYLHRPLARLALLLLSPRLAARGGRPARHEVLQAHLAALLLLLAPLLVLLGLVAHLALPALAG